MKSKSEIKRIAAVNPKQLEEECLKLRHKLQTAEEALEFVIERSGPNKLSESLGTLSHRVADINTKARAALEKLRSDKKEGL